MSDASAGAAEVAPFRTVYLLTAGQAAGGHAAVSVCSGAALQLTPSAEEAAAKYKVGTVELLEERYML